MWGKNKIVEKMQQMMDDGDIKENRDMFFSTNKNDLFLDVYKRGNLALGEAYMNNMWDTPNLYNLFRRIIQTKKYVKFENGNNFFKKIFNPLIQGQTSSLDMINNHYNLSNTFFESWLDPNMQYSCGYWNRPQMTLDEAQIAKMNLIGRKLKLEPGMTVLDIGCGWGMLAQYLAKTFGVNIVGINLSTEHLKYANEKLQNSSDLNVKYIYGDFSEISKYNIKFDRILSVGFYEHLADDRYDEFYKIMHNNLKDDGLVLLHTIGSDHNNKGIDPWILKYIFTRGQIPNLVNIVSHSENNGFVVEDVHNFGMDYGNTLLAWLDRFELSNTKSKYDPKFYKMWKYYLSSCAAAFHEKELFLWQLIFTKKSNKIRYTGVR